jgi:hypothetical protein
MALVYEQEHAIQTQTASGTPYRPTPLPVWTYTPRTPNAIGIDYLCDQGGGPDIDGNCWTGSLTDAWLFAKTLAKKTDPSQGFLIVYTMTLDMGSYGAVSPYLIPDGAGLMLITQADYPYLTLSAPQGHSPASFTFDLESRQWVTATPQPTPSMPASPAPSPSLSPAPTQVP